MKRTEICSNKMESTGFFWDKDDLLYRWPLDQNFRARSKWCMCCWLEGFAAHRSIGDRCASEIGANHQVMALVCPLFRLRDSNWHVGSFTWQILGWAVVPEVIGWHAILQVGARESWAELQQGAIHGWNCQFLYIQLIPCAALRGFWRRTDHWYHESHRKETQWAQQRSSTTDASGAAVWARNENEHLRKNNNGDVFLSQMLYHRDCSRPGAGMNGMNIGLPRSWSQPEMGGFCLDWGPWVRLGMTPAPTRSNSNKPVQKSC